MPSPLAQRTLQTIQADLADRRLDLLIRYYGVLQPEILMVRRELAVIERRLEMIESVEGGR